MEKQAKIVRIHLWDEFREVVTTLRPSYISYTCEKSPFSKLPLAMRLSFGTEGIQYVLLDFAQGEALKHTRIHVHVEKAGEPYLKDEEVKRFILPQLKRTDLSIISCGVLDY